MCNEISPSMMLCNFNIQNYADVAFLPSMITHSSAIVVVVFIDLTFFFFYE
jgi:hypothetical protein